MGQPLRRSDAGLDPGGGVASTRSIPGGLVGLLEAVHQRAVLREGGLPDTEVAQAERLISTAVLGFAASEASGRFRQHDQSVIDADFAELLRWLRRALGSVSDS